MDGGSWHCTGDSKKNWPLETGLLTVCPLLNFFFPRPTRGLLLRTCVFSLHPSPQAWEVLNTHQSVSSVAQSYPTLCNPMNCSTPGLPVYHQLPEFTQTHVHRVSDAIQPSHPLLSPSPAPNPSQHQSLFQWVNSSHEGQSTGVSASASFLPKKSQGWSPSEWTGWISLQSKGLSRVFSNTTVQKHQFFGAQPSSQSNSHIHTCLLVCNNIMPKKMYIP